MNSSKQPFFSIITCTYNSAEFLQDNIKSLQEQNFRGFEHIFVDATSSDGTIEIIKKYQTQSPEQVRVFEQPAKGIAQAMNFGISQAKGQVILCLHSDDYLFESSTLLKVKNIFETTKAEIVVGDCMFTGANGPQLIWPKNKFRRFLQKKFYKNFLFFTNGIPHPSTYVAKSVFNRYGGFSEEYKNVMDYEYWFRVFKKVKVVFTGQALSFYRTHPNTISNLFAERANAEIQKIFQNYSKEYTFERFINAVIFKPLNKLFKLGRGNWIE